MIMVAHIAFERYIILNVKVKVGNEQEMAQSERNSHSKNRGEKNKVKSQVITYHAYYENVS